MKKFLLSILVIAGSVGYALYQSTGAAAAPVAAPVPHQNVSARNAPSASAPAGAPAQIHAPAQKPAGRYLDGTYTGSVADAYYGNVQVQATISGGEITNVVFLQYPNTHTTSVYINSQAMPYLTEEALAVQSANVNTVSGASETSRAFRESLTAALAQAKA